MVGCAGSLSDRYTASLTTPFRAMLRWRKVTRLAAWINGAVSSEFHFLAQFARVLRRDLDAVEQAITSRWSNGPVEGHINRLKMIKRWSVSTCTQHRWRSFIHRIKLVNGCTESA
jgi:transposase